MTDLVILNREENEATLGLYEEWLLTYSKDELGVKR
jgi:hypothetical protein